MVPTRRKYEEGILKQLIQELKKSEYDIIIIAEQLCLRRLKVRYHKIAIVNIHASTEVSKQKKNFIEN